MDEKDPSLTLLYSRGRTVGSREESFEPSSRSSSSMSGSPHSSHDSDESTSQPPPPPTSKTSSSHRRGSLSKVQCTFSYYEPSRHADAKSLLMKRKPAMACLFCRMRKIACAPPVPPETRCKYVSISFPTQPVPPLRYHIILINFTMTLFVWPHTVCDFLPCGPTRSSVGRIAQPMR
jgi:hypothetical protein